MKAMDPKSIQRRFEAAVEVIRTLPEDGYTCSYDLSDEMLVMFYSYFKQATEGPCYTLKPNSWDPIGNAKWEAWKALGNMSKDQAMMEYVQEIQLIVETIPVTEMMEELMDALEPFYDIVEDENDVLHKGAQLLLSTVPSDSYKNIEDRTEMEEKARGSLLKLCRFEEESSVTTSIHSSLNSEDEEEELAYDDSEDEMEMVLIDKPETPKKGSEAPRDTLADLSPLAANVQQGGNIEPQCGSADGKPQELPPPIPHPPKHRPVQADRISACSEKESQLMEAGQLHIQQNASEGKREDVDGQRDATDRMERQAFNAQVTAILSQLEDNMQEVLHQLTTLEDLTESQAVAYTLKDLDSTSPKLVYVVLVPFKPELHTCSADRSLAVCCTLAHAGLFTEKEELNIKMDESMQTEPPSWIKQHAVYQELMHLDVEDSAQVYAAFLVYMDLTEVRKWKAVTGVSCSELNAVLLEGQETEDESVQRIYPLPSHRPIKHRELRSILDKGSPLLLCAVASDSTLVYQRLCDGFVTPEPPVDVQDQGRRQHRKRRLQT
ncbi:hypothetical protein DNTS_002594 [Danionella cerebrum]|uniref:ACB domain-containing protein n=1 Tax=Danionella cerebrum TaxID=2873325 RepID=A0A553R5V2_9TELE|nr:hypothetical protein DNTS_002594 [Danionella translucida]